MSRNLLSHSLFYDVLFPKIDQERSQDESLNLRRLVTYRPALHLLLSSATFVIFDLETTGLDSNTDRIVEIGAQKICRGQVLGEFEELVDPRRDFPIEAQKVSGITPDMLEGKRDISQVLPDFLKFIEGGILVAHNANFDMGFIRKSASRQGLDLAWPAFCTLKLARELLPDLERKTLDSLANHFDLSFEARHRSIGDVKVTVDVLQRLLSGEGSYLESWSDLEPFYS